MVFRLLGRLRTVLYSVGRLGEMVIWCCQLQGKVWHSSVLKRRLVEMVRRCKEGYECLLWSWCVGGYVCGNVDWCVGDTDCKGRLRFYYFFLFL